jgi:hypothetical protein
MTTSAQEHNMYERSPDLAVDASTPVSDLVPTQDGNGHRDRLEISWADLNDSSVTARVAEMQTARQIPLVQTVGAAADESPTGLAGLLRGSVVTLVIAGIVGAVATWGLVELLLKPDADSHWFGSSVTTGNVLMTVAWALGLGLVISGWEGVQARSWVKARNAMLKAAVVLIPGGIVGGFLADKIYHSMTQNLIRDALNKALAQGTDETSSLQIFQQYMQDHMHLPRGIAIGIVGVAVGAGLGAATRSVRRALNGAVGGFVGGFLGGFVFDYVGSGSSSGVMPRLVATGITGILVGVSVGLIETARRENWLEIVSGGMAGKQFILYRADSTIGSGADCDVTLIKDPAIQARHASLVRTANGLSVRALDAAGTVLVNGQPVSDYALHDGDLVQFGSTVVRYRAKNRAQPTPGVIAG